MINCQNWKLTSCPNWKLPKLKIAKLLNCQLVSLRSWSEVPSFLLFLKIWNITVNTETMRWWHRIRAFQTVLQLSLKIRFQIFYTIIFKIPHNFFKCNELALALLRIEISSFLLLHWDKILAKTKILTNKSIPSIFK